MTEPHTIECDIRFSAGPRGRREAATPDDRPEPTQRPHGRVPRVARLMALAIRFDQHIAEGAVSDYAELARLGHVTRARITQIMNLLMLAPDIQEAILFSPRVERGRDPICLRQLQAIAGEPEWRKQRQLWSKLTASEAAKAAL